MMMLGLMILTLFYSVSYGDEGNCWYGNCTTDGGQIGRVCQDEWMGCLYCPDASAYNCDHCDCGEVEQAAKGLATLTIIIIVGSVLGCIACCICCCCMYRNKSNQTSQVIVNMPGKNTSQQPSTTK